jgi:hypothetical protein
MHALSAIPLFAAAALPLFAQTDCPHTKTKDIPAGFVTGASVDCDAGINLAIGGVTVTSAQRACPLFVVVTPTHQEIVKSELATRTEQNGNAQELMAFFRCTPHYLLFIRLGDTCELDRTLVIGAVPLLRTIECASATIRL